MGITGSKAKTTVKSPAIKGKPKSKIISKPTPMKKTPEKEKGQEQEQEETKQITTQSHNQKSSSPKEEIKSSEQVKPDNTPKDNIGSATVKYNHYGDSFGTKNGILLWETVDEKYCISFVFKGNYVVQLKAADGTVLDKSEEGGFSPIEDGGVYQLVVEEDPEEVAKQVTRTYVAPKDDGIKKKQGVSNITGDLKKMSIDQLQEKGEEYKQMIEARDLEDILYS